MIRGKKQRLFMSISRSRSRAGFWMGSRSGSGSRSMSGSMSWSRSILSRS